MTLAVFGQSMPAFWFGLMLIILFAVTLRWLPTSGTGDWRNLVMPSVTLGINIVPQVLLLTRSSLIETLHEQYITVARSKGLGEARVIRRHALANSLNPVVTMVGLQFGTLMGGAVITETVFAWPGVGQLAIQAIFNRDMPVVQAGVVVMGTAIVLSNIIVDCVNAALDPRIRAA
jgi:ABC-type dipeptide/oligopeptide/nickel transport system permease component